MAILVFQFAKSQTTETEYNYITRGLLQDKKDGRDMKEGYTMQLVTSPTIINYGDKSWRSVTLFYFKKGTVNKAFILECTDSKGNKRYMCIPAYNSAQPIWDMAFNEFKGEGSEWQIVFFWAMAKLSSMKLL